MRGAPLPRTGYRCGPARHLLATSRSRPAPPRASPARSGGGPAQERRALPLVGGIATCSLAPPRPRRTHPPHGAGTSRPGRCARWTGRAVAQGRRGAPRCPGSHTRAPRPASRRWPPRGRGAGGGDLPPRRSSFRVAVSPLPEAVSPLSSQAKEELVPCACPVVARSSEPEKAEVESCGRPFG